MAGGKKPAANHSTIAALNMLKVWSRAAWLSAGTAALPFN